MGNGPYDLLAGIYRPLLERFRGAAREAGRAQRGRLTELLSRDSETVYGRRYGFSSIRSEDEFRRRVPGIEFEDVAGEVERIANGEKDVLARDAVTRFVTTSGTTGPAKRIPVTASLAREVRDAQMVWLIHMLKENPKQADGDKITLVSPEASSRTPAGIPVGANTGRMQRALPWFVRLGSRPPKEVLALQDAGLRGWLTALSAAGSDAGILTTANPSTVWLLAKRLREWADPIAEALERGGIPEFMPGDSGASSEERGPGRPRGEREGAENRRELPVPEDVRWALRRRFKPRKEQARRLRAAAASGGPLFPALWPRLTTVNCWRGGPAAFYLQKLEAELGGIPVRDPGFSASEGFFAVPLESGTASGVLLSHGPYFEFEPVGGGEMVGVEDVQEGREYEIRITTCGGLWRYAMRDVIRVTGWWERSPLVEFVRKSGHVLSITGEKVTEAHVLSASAVAARECGFGLAGAGAMIEKGDPPRYLALIEAEGTRFATGNPARNAGPRRHADELERNGTRSGSGDLPEPVERGRSRAKGRESQFAAAFDRALREANVEYDGKRADGRLGDAGCRILPPGSFEARRRRLVEAGAPEAQVKTPVLFPDGW